MAPTASIEENLNKSLHFAKKAKALGAHLALLPEVWQLGYDQTLLNKTHAIDETHTFVASHREQAKALSMAIAVTFLKRTNDKPHNQVSVFDGKGNGILEYAKVHTCDFEGGTERGLSSGETFDVASLVFDEGSLKIGAMICMDREFPESARTLALKGAEIVIIPNACPVATCKTLSDARLASLRAMSYENLIGVAMANYPKSTQDFDGHSCAFDNLGSPIVMGDEKEGIFIATFDLSALRAVRENEWKVRGAPARHPKAYTL